MFYGVIWWKNFIFLWKCIFIMIFNFSILFLPKTWWQYPKYSYKDLKVLLFKIEFNLDWSLFLIWDRNLNFVPIYKHLSLNNLLIKLPFPYQKAMLSLSYMKLIYVCGQFISGLYNFFQWPLPILLQDGHNKGQKWYGPNRSRRY